MHFDEQLSIAMMKEPGLNATGSLGSGLGAFVVLMTTRTRGNTGIEEVLLVIRCARRLELVSFAVVVSLSNMFSATY